MQSVIKRRHLIKQIYIKNKQGHEEYVPACFGYLAVTVTSANYQCFLLRCIVTNIADKFIMNLVVCIHLCIKMVRQSLFLAKSNKQSRYIVLKQIQVGCGIRTVYVGLFMSGTVSSAKSTYVIFQRQRIFMQNKLTKIPLFFTFVSVDKRMLQCYT